MRSLWILRPYHSCAEGSSLLAPHPSAYRLQDLSLCLQDYNALHGRGPTYLSRTWNPVRDVSARIHLRSAIRGDLTVPRTRTRRFGSRSFRVSGPVVRNSLPEDIPELSLECFKSTLKTHLFRQAYAYQRSQRFCDLVKERLLISVSYIYIYIWEVWFQWNGTCDRLGMTKIRS